MAVLLTQALTDELLRDDLDPEELADAFGEWKAAGPEKDDNHYWFGKDAAYEAPKAGRVPYSLRHVHLVPLAIPAARDKWDVDWKRRSRRTSDRVLVYTQDNRGSYLLIYILPEGEAHKVATMSNAQDRETMEGFAATAAAFLEDGDIIA